MKISSKGRYALIFMSYLAKNYSKNIFISLKEVSDNENLSYKYLEKIVSILNKNDFFEVSRGVNGGYKLKFSPDKYIIGDILRVAEGTLSSVSCVDNETCNKKNECSAFLFFKGLYNNINEYVDSKTLKDFI